MVSHCMGPSVCLSCYYFPLREDAETRGTGLSDPTTVGVIPIPTKSYAGHVSNDKDLKRLINHSNDLLPGKLGGTDMHTGYFGDRKKST